MITLSGTCSASTSTSATTLSGVPNIVLTVNIATSSETFTIPCANDGTFNATINWGDGTADSTITAYNDGDLAHTYTDSAGTRVISIYGSFPNIFFNGTGDKDKLLTVHGGDFRYMAYAYYLCTNLTTVDINITNDVTSFYNTFRQCSSLETINLTRWDMSNVTSMYCTFRQCPVLNPIDFSQWPKMYLSGGGATGIVQNTNATNTLDVSCFDVSGVNTINWLFYDTDFQEIIGLEDWDVSNCVSLYSAFRNTNGLAGTTLDLSNWDVSSVTSMLSAFLNCKATTISGIENWTTGALTGTAVQNLFSGCTNLTTPLDLTGFNVSGCTDLSWAFYNCSLVPSIDVSNWDTSSATLMGSTFRKCQSITSLDLSNWDVSSVTTLNQCFYGCDNAVTIDLTGWTTGALVSTGLQNLFLQCYDLETVTVSGFNTSGVTDLQNAFNACDSLTYVDIYEWDIEAVATWSNFMSSGVTLDTDCYDAILIAWDAQNPLDSKTVSFGSSKYSSPGPAAEARASLISTDSWTIQDGGSVPYVQTVVGTSAATTTTSDIALSLFIPIVPQYLTGAFDVYTSTTDITLSTGATFIVGGVEISKFGGVVCAKIGGVG